MGANLATKETEIAALAMHIGGGAIASGSIGVAGVAGSTKTGPALLMPWVQLASPALQRELANAQAPATPATPAAPATPFKLTQIAMITPVTGKGAKEVTDLLLLRVLIETTIATASDGFEYVF